jgi:hypothetical protein
MTRPSGLHPWHRSLPLSGGRRGQSARQYRRDEAKRSGEGAFGFRHDLVEAAPGQTAIRQVGIKDGQPKGQGIVTGAIAVVL